MIRIWIDTECIDLVMFWGILVKEDDKTILELWNYKEPHTKNDNELAKYLALEEVLGFLLKQNLNKKRISIKSGSYKRLKQQEPRVKFKPFKYDTYRCRVLLENFKKLTFKETRRRDLKSIFLTEKAKKDYERYSWF